MPQYTKGDQKYKNKFIYKKLCIYSYMFKHRSPSKYSIWCNTPIETFFHCPQNSIWTCQFWCPLFFCCFLFHLFHISRTFPFEDFFHPGKQTKKSNSRQDWVNRVVHGGHDVLGHKVLNTQHGVAGVLVNHPSWNGQTRWKGLQKEFTEAEHSLSHLCQLVHWYRCIPKTLT